MNRTWYSKKTFILFVFLSISLIFLFSGRNIELGNSANSKYAVYSIRFEYFGMDAANIERIITIPLEEKISCMSNLLELRSTVEYGKSTTTAYFSKKIKSRNTYLEIRNYVDTLYNDLPSSVQKPKIYSSDTTEKSVISIALNGTTDLNSLRSYVNDILKPKIESIDGVSEVIVVGGTVNEILIEFDKEKIISYQINPTDFGAIIQDANVVNASGKIKNDYQNTVIVFDTKLNDINDVKKLPVKIEEGYTSLEYFADVSVKPRENEEIVRINGEECVSLQVSSSYLGNNIYISKEVKKVLKNSNLKEENYQILQDNGQETYKIIKNVIIALIESFICIIIVIPFFYQSKRIIVLLLFIIPANVLWTLAQLNIFNFPIDQNILSGITISLGLIADSSLIISETSEKSFSFLEFEKKVKNLYSAIISSSITTILALIPLYFLDNIVPGIKSIAITIALMIFNSTIITLFFLPAFIYESAKSGKSISAKFVNKIYRLNYRISYWSIKHKKSLRVLFVFLCISPILLFFVLGKNIELSDSANIIYAQVEYENEKSMNIIDDEVNAIIPIMQKIYGVNFISTESRKGSCEIEIGFDDEKIDRFSLVNKIADFSSCFTEGFLYVPEKGQKVKTNNHQIEITVFGDESKKCRTYAEEIVKKSSKNPFILQSVLNFKKAEQEIILQPDVEFISKNGGTVEDIASQLRWNLFGPVVDKWIQNGKEMDIRIVGKNAKTLNLSDLENTYIILGQSSNRLSNIGSLKKESGLGKIFRNDNRRCAYCTLSVNARSSDEAIKLTRNIINNINFEKGYGAKLSRDLEYMNKQYFVLFLVFIACVFFIVLFLIAITEDFKKTFFIISIIPSSLFIPFIYKFLSKVPLELGDVVGMILVSGISVNNSIYIMESRKSKVIYKVRDKVRSIIVTSLTSIIGAVPLIIRNSGTFASQLSLFMLLGIFGSVIVSLFIFPGIISE